MGQMFTKPITIEQKEKIKQRKESKTEQERKDEQDLINIYLLQELALIKGAMNNANGN